VKREQKSEEEKGNTQKNSASFLKLVSREVQ